MTTKKIKTSCPNCGKKDTWKEDNAFKPFCCERCKLIDLGEWASEARRIAGDPVSRDTDSEDEEV